MACASDHEKELKTHSYEVGFCFGITMLMCFVFDIIEVILCACQCMCHGVEKRALLF